MQLAIYEYSKLTDAELVELSKQGDRQAFGDLFRRHRRKCVYVAGYFLRNHSDAEDQAQNALLKAYQHLGQYQGDAEFATWLARIVANECLMLIRMRRRAKFVYLDESGSEQKTLPIQLPSAEPDPEGELASLQLAQVLRLEVSRIPRLMRDVMLLCDIEGLPIRDVAEYLGITVSAAKSRLVRARTELRSRMNKHCGRLRDNFPVIHSAAPLSRVGRHCFLQLAS